MTLRARNSPRLARCIALLLAVAGLVLHSAGMSVAAAATVVSAAAAAPVAPRLATPAEPAGRAVGATAGPSPTPPADAPVVPEDVARWFAANGAEAAGSAGVADDADLAVGNPRQVAVWAQAYIDGEEMAAPAEPIEEWVAPVVLQSAQEPQPAGVVRAGTAGGAGPELLAVTTDVELAAALTGLPGSVTVVHDDGVDGWFATLDGEVWPVTEGARTVLQGSVPADVFQEFLAGRLGEPGATTPPPADVAGQAAVTPLLPIAVIVVVGAGAAWLLLRQYRRADSRIAADVHAGIAPPRDGADGTPSASRVADGTPPAPVADGTRRDRGRPPPERYDG